VEIRVGVTVVATVGTTHPLAFAGLVFDALALAGDGARAVCVVAGVSAQDAQHVTARVPVAPDAIRAQFVALHDANVAAFHVGALLSADTVRAVADGLALYAGVPVVVDPVLAASGGDALADDATRTALREALIPRATLVTPNLHEAGVLTGRTVHDVATMREAASSLVAHGARAALIKGGHLASDPIDVLADGALVRELPSHRVEGSVRGSGDLLAITIATCLARGATLVEAIEHARRRVREAISSAVPFANTRVARLFTRE
jgi:hydroxymethylpyrimidine kinase/phosphomethylpyrimidine kinase